jgi:hypothetical protein
LIIVRCNIPVTVQLPNLLFALCAHSRRDACGPSEEPE